MRQGEQRDVPATARPSGAVGSMTPDGSPAQTASILPTCLVRVLRMTSTGADAYAVSATGTDAVSATGADAVSATGADAVSATGIELTAMLAWALARSASGMCSQ